MTNVARQRRGLAQSALCPLCNSEDEPLIHIFRDCSKVKQIWWLVSKGKFHVSFFSSNEASWMETNVREDSSLDGLGWNVWLGITTMTIWQLRNEVVFQGINISIDQAFHWIYHQASWVKTSIQDASCSPELLLHNVGWTI